MCAGGENDGIVRGDAGIGPGMSIAFRNPYGTDVVCQQPTCSFILPVPARGSILRPGLVLF